jgi:hypothetical protein
MRATYFSILAPLIAVFACHAPHHKEAVVAAFHHSGLYTLMVEDGTNDPSNVQNKLAPAENFLGRVLLAARTDATAFLPCLCEYIRPYPCQSTDVFHPDSTTLLLTLLRASPV